MLPLKSLEKETRSYYISMWAPLNGPVEDSPLAVCDYQSVDEADLVPVDIVFPYGTMEVYDVKYNSNHKWVYLDKQRNDDVLLFKTYDSERGVAQCMSSCSSAR